MMANIVMGLKSTIPDISCRPTRIQDIPREILGHYGIVIVNEDGFVSDGDEDYEETGRLVIDESDFKPLDKYEECKKNSTKPINLDIGKIPIKQRREIQEAIQQFQITTSDGMLEPIIYCNRCKKLICNDYEHNDKHCFFERCPDIIETESERELHKKIHDHPTKPLQCKFCKKRYRYHSYVEKHAPYCKAKRKTSTAKENWKRESAKALSV